MIWVVFDPVAETGVLFVKGMDRTDDGTVTKLFEKAIIGCETEEKAREILVKMFGNRDGWLDHGRFIIRPGTQKQMDKLVKDTGVSDIWDGEKISKWEAQR